MIDRRGRATGPRVMAAAFVGLGSLIMAGVNAEDAMSFAYTLSSKIQCGPAGQPNNLSVENITDGSLAVTLQEFTNGTQKYSEDFNMPAHTTQQRSLDRTIDDVKLTDQTNKGIFEQKVNCNADQTTTTTMAPSTSTSTATTSTTLASNIALPLPQPPPNDPVIQEQSQFQAPGAVPGSAVQISQPRATTVPALARTGSSPALLALAGCLLVTIGAFIRLGACRNPVR